MSILDMLATERILRCRAASLRAEADELDIDADIVRHEAWQIVVRDMYPGDCSLCSPYHPDDEEDER